MACYVREEEDIKRATVSAGCASHVDANSSWDRKDGGCKTYGLQAQATNDN